MACDKKEVKAAELVWSVHRDTNKLDRAGKASAKSFMYISHSRLVEILEWGRGPCHFR